jgi:hypothetical protein
VGVGAIGKNGAVYREVLSVIIQSGIVLECGKVLSIPADCRFRAHGELTIMSSWRFDICEGVCAVSKVNNHRSRSTAHGENKPLWRIIYRVVTSLC